MNAAYTFKVPSWLDRIFIWPVMIYRFWKYGYTYRRIYLGDEEWTILDQQDYYYLSKFKWYIKGSYGKFYAARNYKYDSRQTKMITMHREIMDYPAGLLVDHKNGNGLDNRRDNLRLATHSQNMINRPKSKNTSSKFVGVFFCKSRKKWVATINCQNKRIWLGRFDNEEDAARAYDRAAIKYFDEFARLNFS